MTMQVELSDGPITIRPYRIEDIKPIYEAIRESLNELVPWMPWCHPDYKIQETETFIRSRVEGSGSETDYGFAITDSETGEILGSVGLSEVDRGHLNANLGYWVRTSCTGRGVASTATRLLARYALTELGLQRIKIVASVHNHASQRTAEKAGAVREGIQRKGLRYHDQPHDAVLYSLIAEDVL